MTFRDEPLKIKIFTILVTIAAVLFLFLHIPQKQLLLSTSFLFFVLLRILLDQLDIPLPNGNASVSVTFAIDLAMIVLFGPAAVAWSNVATLFHVRLLKQFNQYWHKIIYNTAQLVLSAGLAGYAFKISGGIVGMRNAAGEIILQIIPILASILVFFIANTILVMAVLSMSQKMSFIGVWLTNFRWSVPNYLATSPLGILIAAVYVSMKAPGVLLLILPLMVARHTFIMYMDMRNQYISTIKALTKAIDAKDHYTHGHSERVAQYTVWIAQEMRLPEDFQEKLEYLALMHDIGKIGIPEQILNKPSRLSDEEFQLVRDHAAVGADIIENIKYIGEHADIVRHHHERVDGRGYPDHLSGDQMSLGAKIVGVADAYDAMTSDRIYRDPMSREEAVQEMIRCSNSQFDENVVNAFIRVLKRKGEIS